VYYAGAPASDNTIGFNTLRRVQSV